MLKNETTMNPIQLAGLLIMLLALTSKANAGNHPEVYKKSSFGALIAAQFKLKPGEAEQIKNKTVRFYFTVDSTGRVKQVVAAEADPVVKQMLEERFKQVKLMGYPVNAGGRVDLKFILN
jgi:hypothetical protein